MKIGILGGSFNPPHKGHVHISCEALKELELEQVWWLPTKQNPLKKANVSRETLNDSKEMFHVKHLDFNGRVKKCQEITEEHSQILVRDYEGDLESLYSLDLVKNIIEKHPENQFFFIIGADNIVNFHLWHKWKEIIDLAPLIIVDRGDYFDQAIKSEAYLYCKKLDRCYYLKGNKCDISSTQIRNNEI